MTDPIVIYRCRKCELVALNQTGTGCVGECLWKGHDWQELHAYDPETHIAVNRQELYVYEQSRTQTRPEHL